MMISELKAEPSGAEAGSPFEVFMRPGAGGRGAPACVGTTNISSFQVIKWLSRFYHRRQFGLGTGRAAPAPTAASRTSREGASCCRNAVNYNS